LVFDGNEVAGASFSEVLLPSKREKESEVADDKARCRENEILFSRRVDWDMLACTTYKERERGGHGAWANRMPLYSQLHGSKPWRAKVANKPFLL